jgi:ACS family 4-hydroxyphenylacetate permease-like MFS transporter
MAGSSDFTPEEQAAFAKVSRRIIWFILLLAIVNYLDRTNIGFAQLTMGKELGVSATVFGTAVTVFSIVYAAFEIPSNLALQKFGARLWLARILITWGIASSACALASGPTSLIVLRGLVGAAEAGFIPGLVLYLTYWYPQYYRARAQSGFMIAQPIAIAGGSILSGAILSMDGFFNVSGWRWLFVIEGVPAIALGVWALFYLTDRPVKALWLTQREREVVDAAVRREAETREKTVAFRTGSVFGMMFRRDILLISAAYFTLIGNFGSGGYWTPQIVRAISSPTQPFWVTGLLSSGPYLLAIAAIPLWSAYSDRVQERYWTVIVPMAIGGFGWIVAALAPTPALQYAGLVAAQLFTLPVWSLFFTMPSSVLPREAHAAGIAFMNTIGMVGASIAPLVIGVLRDQTGGFTAPMLVVGASVVCGAATMLLLPRHPFVGAGEAPPAAATPAR